MQKLILAITVCLFATTMMSAQALKFTTQPTMMQATANTIILKWETSLPTHTEVQYSTSANMNWREDVAETTLHEIILSDLEPATTYYVRVISKSGKSGIVTPLKQFSTTTLMTDVATPTGIGTK